MNVYDVQVGANKCTSHMRLPCRNGKSSTSMSLYRRQGQRIKGGNATQGSGACLPTLCASKWNWHSTDEHEDCKRGSPHAAPHTKTLARAGSQETGILNEEHLQQHQHTRAKDHRNVLCHARPLQNASQPPDATCV